MSDAISQPETTPSFFTGEPQHDTLSRMKDFFPTGEMKASSSPVQIPEGAAIELPQNYEFDGKTRSTEEFIVDTDTSALLVLKDGAVCLERYLLTGGRDVQWMSFSVAKSFISALIGIAVEDGSIASIEDPISDYVPSLRGSAYDGVRIVDVLQMSSGVRWDENYSDPDAEIHGFNEVMAGKGSFENFLAGMQREREPGTVCLYNSADTQALGLLLVKATGRSISDYMQEKLCEPLGMEAPGYWLLDCDGLEMAAGGVNLTARDFARIGELFRNKGQWNGQQIIPQSWASASVTPGAPHVMPGEVVVGDHNFSLGYGYQWWIPAGERGEFSAIGIYNQFVYVDPSRGVVIVKLSANRAYGTSSAEAVNREDETIEFLRAIASEFDLTQEI
jgi:CubicO group peptidase (beta-lactamase class C family)